MVILHLTLHGVVCLLGFLFLHLCVFRHLGERGAAGESDCWLETGGARGASGDARRGGHCRGRSAGQPASRQCALRVSRQQLHLRLGGRREGLLPDDRWRPRCLRRRPARRALPGPLRRPASHRSVRAQRPHQRRARQVTSISSWSASSGKRSLRQNIVPLRPIHTVRRYYEEGVGNGWARGALFFYQGLSFSLFILKLIFLHL